MPATQRRRLLNHKDTKVTKFKTARWIFFENRATVSKRLPFHLPSSRQMKTKTLCAFLLCVLCAFVVQRPATFLSVVLVFYDRVSGVSH